jgi:prephenate dehydratase
VTPGQSGARLRLAFLGPIGTFTHAALLTLEIASCAELIPMASVILAIDAVRSGAADGAFVPLENSVEGAVPATLDELASPTPLLIAEEAYLPVVFDLLAKRGARLDRVRTVATHPHAEAQTRRWLNANIPQARIVLVDSTAAGAQAVAAGRFDAAIAHPAAAQVGQLSSLAHDIADNRSAVTRFILLKKNGVMPASSGNDRTSIIAYLRNDHAGALLDILAEFASRGINLTRIESRPTKSRIGQYCFFVDCEGHVADERVGDALAAVRRVCADVRFLGSYPRRHGTTAAIAVGSRDSDFVAARRWLAAIPRTEGEVFLRLGRGRLSG